MPERFTYLLHWPIFFMDIIANLKHQHWFIQTYQTISTYSSTSWYSECHFNFPPIEVCLSFSPYCTFLTLKRWCYPYTIRTSNTIYNKNLNFIVISFFANSTKKKLQAFHSTCRMCKKSKKGLLLQQSTVRKWVNFHYHFIKTLQKYWTHHCDSVYSMSQIHENNINWSVGSKEFNFENLKCFLIVYLLCNVTYCLRIPKMELFHLFELNMAA